jgi:hypothetical protein
LTVSGMQQHWRFYEIGFIYNLFTIITSGVLRYNPLLYFPLPLMLFYKFIREPCNACLVSGLLRLILNQTLINYEKALRIEKRKRVAAAIAAVGLPWAERLR